MTVVLSQKKSFLVLFDTQGKENILTLLPRSTVKTFLPINPIDLFGQFSEVELGRLLFHVAASLVVFSDL